ncbi:DNA-binding protein [Klebsiella sp. CLS1-1]|uniref:DNA-binding protein n=1 Tax=Morganella TaxID=581 RepID=UPI00301D7157
MSKITYEFSVVSPYVSLKEYSRISGISLSTCRAMVKRGEIIIRPKIREKDTVQVNLIAMLKDALRNS